MNPIKTMVLSDGSKYEGHLSKKLPEGVGRKTSKTGDYYIGEFSNGLEHGYGSWYNKQGTLQYRECGTKESLPWAITELCKHSMG